MASNSLLIKIPSSHFCLNTLRPDAGLAQLAGYLHDADHTTRIWDFGTLEMIERLFPKSLHKHAIERGDTHWTESVQPNYLTKFNRMVSRKSSSDLQRHEESVWKEIAEAIFREKSLDFIAFSLDSASDLAAYERIIPLIRFARPRLRLLGVGRLFDRDQDSLPACLPLFDCVSWGHSGTHFMRWVEEINTPERWTDIPNLAYSDGVRMYMTKAGMGASTNHKVSPDYSYATYPALMDDTKLLYFDIEEVSGGRIPGQQCVKSPSIIVDEIKALREQFQSMVFHFTGCSGEIDHADALARELLTRHMNIRYTRECHVATAPPHTISALSASGCYGVDFQIDSGSQRLLDTYYHHPFGVTQVEQVIRACTFSNVFTLMNFSYPSVEDDYHTRAETLRLIQRCKPHATHVSIPLQVHRRTTDLRTRFTVEPNHRSASKIVREHEDLCREVQDLGISTKMTAPLSLMAELSGFRGQEIEFLQQMDYQFMTGDVQGIETAINRINLASSKVSGALAFTPFNRLQHVVGN